MDGPKSGRDGRDVGEQGYGESCSWDRGLGDSQVES